MFLAFFPVFVSIFSIFFQDFYSFRFFSNFPPPRVSFFPFSIISSFRHIFISSILQFLGQLHSRRRPNAHSSALTSSYATAHAIAHDAALARTHTGSDLLSHLWKLSGVD